MKSTSEGRAMTAGLPREREPRRLEWAGFAPLRKGRIHVFCPSCGRKHSNAERTELDPPTAELVHVWCEKCSQGCKSDLGSYFDGRGRVLHEELNASDKIVWVAERGR